MKASPILLLALAASLLPFSACAASLTWADCVAEAKAHNPQWLQAEESLRQAQIAELSAKAQFLPKASLSASASQGGAYHPLSEDQSFDPAQPTAYGLGLNASLNLFSGFSNLAALRAATAKREAAEASRDESLAGLNFDLRKAFGQLIFASEQIKLSDELAARALENQDMVELRYDSGVENKGSYLQAKALASQARFSAERSRRQLRSASLQLSQLLGREPDAALTAQGSLVWPDAPPEPDFASLMESLPSTRRARLQRDAARAARQGAYAPFLPSLNAAASLNRSDSSWAPQQGSWSAGLTLSYPFFSGFSDSLALQQAKSSLDATALAYSQARLQARLDLESAWQGLVDAVARVQLNSESLQASQARAEIGRAQYAQGLMNFENWDRIESDLSSALRTELSGHLDAATAKAAWDRALGKGFEP